MEQEDTYTEYGGTELKSIMKNPCFYEKKDVRREITKNLREMRDAALRRKSGGEENADRGAIKDIGALLFRFSDLDKKLAIALARDYVQNNLGREHTEKYIVDIFSAYSAQTRQAEKGELEEEVILARGRREMEFQDYNDNLIFWNILKQLEESNEPLPAIYQLLQSEPEEVKETLPRPQDPEMCRKIAELERQVAELSQQRTQDGRTLDESSKLEAEIESLKKQVYILRMSTPQKYSITSETEESLETVENKDKPRDRFRGIVKF
ncbi:MAG: hypothetical protein PVG65_01000 [Candidatus Thorarchaeota archaeon]